VGYETSDDAAVYRLSAGTAVVTTADYITPPVDDPVWFGRIAAANALSDVYAMGGRPLTALNLVMYPMKKLGPEILKEILRGGHEVVTAAGACLAGGHSVEDEEPKYGLSVTGVVHPDRILRNVGARPGDALVLTKPLGTGVLFNAVRSRRLPRRHLDPVLPQLAALNRTALDVALKFSVHACTDVTGFGLAGHALEMAAGSRVGIDLRLGALPLYPEALAMYRKGETTGSNAANRRLCEGRIAIPLGLFREQEEILFDPQTSGGLLLAVPGEEADALVDALRAAGVGAAVRVAEVSEAAQPGIRVL
jgi:selenide,water dikinase